MRIFFSEIKDNKAYFNKQDSYHITHVLRKKINSIIKCYSVADKISFDAKIISLKPLVGLIDLSSIKKFNDKNVDITCYLGVIKKNNFELAAEKLNEIGIKKMVPVLFERSQNNINLDFERINKICYESCKQCNRMMPIEVESIINFAEMIKKLVEIDSVFVADIADDSISLSSYDSLFGKKVAYIIGPEGGFTKDEIVIFKKIRNLKFLKLTDNILRSETAAIYLGSILFERVTNEK
ncbi:MAG: 16S rRNA (uracil(1498)-N(3))-methyltransferase [Mycoplasma sp.]|nr:16S rRNA (uracil(1498)-N(3))-methyltransferase [Mycoplasma sp.]